MLGERCSHGKTWAESCPECDLVSAREFVQRWGVLVDEARAKIAEAEQRQTEWISVCDRLPTRADGLASKTKVYVTAMTNGGKVKECGYHLACGGWDDEDYSPGMRITHWKPKAEKQAA